MLIKLADANVASIPSPANCARFVRVRVCFVRCSAYHENRSFIFRTARDATPSPSHASSVHSSSLFRVQFSTRSHQHTQPSNLSVFAILIYTSYNIHTHTSYTHFEFVCALYFIFYMGSMQGDQPRNSDADDDDDHTPHSHALVQNIVRVRRP